MCILEINYLDDLRVKICLSVNSRFIFFVLFWDSFLEER